MIEQFKNLCILKAFDIENDILEKCKKVANVNGIQLIIENNYFDYKFCIENFTASEVDFQSVVSAIVDLLGDKMYCDCDKQLEEVLVDLATSKNVKIACAESITGGLVCANIVNVSGSSSVLNQGIVTYTNEAKVRLLHVKLSTLQMHGAVSMEVATQMCQSLLVNKNIDIAISTTGCAGPNSDEMDTPIGLAYIGYGNKNNLSVVECFYEGTRNYVRNCVARKAIYVAWQFIKNNY